MIADVVVDLQYGDCGKGKITHALCRERGYTHVIRYNGGCNAGHTIYHEGKKFVTHHIPCGVFFGIKSIIGPGCVVHTETFLKEVQMLEDAHLCRDSVVAHLRVVEFDSRLVNLSTFRNLHVSEPQHHQLREVAMKNKT